MSNFMTLADVNHYSVEIPPFSNAPADKSLTTEQNIRRLLGVPYEGAQPALIHFSPTRESAADVGIAYVWEIPSELNDQRTGGADDPFMEEARRLLRTFVERNSGPQKSYSFMIIHALDAEGQSVGARGISYPFKVEQPSLPSGNARSIAAPVRTLGSGRNAL